MDWFGVIFVMVMLNRLSSIQKEIHDIEDNSTMLEFIKSTIETSVTPICNHRVFDLEVFGCRNTENLTLNFKWHRSGEENDRISRIQPTDNSTHENCHKFKKSGSLFMANINESQSNHTFCEEYVLLSESDIPIYYIEGISLSKVQSECPAEEELCVIDKSIATCPLTNFTITPALHKNDLHGYINLQISWDKTDKDDNVSIRILQKIGKEYKTDCLQEMHEFSLPLLHNNAIVKPNMVTSQEIEPGCTYDVFMFSDWGQRDKINCTYVYQVPECVESRCDCDKFKPKPKILSIEQLTDNKFLVRWDPGPTTISNSPQTIQEVHFGYDFSNKAFDIYRELPEALKNDVNGYTSEMKMKLFDGENYTLTGTFTNNFSCSADYKFQFTAPTGNNNNILIIVSFSIAIMILIAVITAYKRIPKYKNKVLDVLRCNRRDSQHHELTRLHTGQVPMNTNIQYIPVEFLEGSFDAYEFPRNKIILKEVIGSGAFGQVYSAKAIGIGDIEGYKIVAVKTLGDGEHISRDATNDFIAEIEIFKKIGNHPNVVTLLGCCTLSPPYMMIMEFVPCGDLKNYLLELREQWLKKKGAEKRQIFFPDTSDGAYIEAPAPTTPASITSSRLPSTSETVCTTVDDPMTPLLSQYTLDKVLDHTELQNFALQIARGMAHLEGISVTHRDLAARNILINEYKTLKISDFGLSRCGPYINHKTKKLPLRWMAIEAIVGQKYDSKSDVWSFGVVLWEIGTLGAFPYESVLDSFLQQFLQMGRRLDRPEICTDELYALMAQCWASDPEKRPTFQELVEALDVKKRKIYVNFNQLNPTYIFPPSDMDKFVENPVRIVDIDV